MNRRLWIVFGFVFLLVLFNSSIRVFNRDEFEAIHSSWKVLNSGLIYVDFFQTHHPLLYFVCAPIIALLGENITTLFVLRAMSLCMVLGMFSITYMIATKLFDRKVALLSIVLLVSIRIFITRAIEVRPDTPQVLLGLISILFLLIFYEKRSHRYLIISSVSLAISLLFLQKAIFLIFLVGLILTVDLFRKQISIKNLLLYFIVFVITLIPFYIYIFSTGSFDNYLFFSWLVNADLPYRHSPLGDILKTLRRNTLLWFFYFPGLWLILKSKYRNDNRIRLGVLSAGLLSCIFFIRMPTPQYYMHSVPLISIIAAFAMRTFLSSNPKRLLIIVIIGTSIPALALVMRPFKKPNLEQVKRFQYVLSTTDRSDLVYDPNRYFNFFREDIDYFWFVMLQGSTVINTKITMTEFNGFEPCKSIETTKPILVADRKLGKECEYIKANYKKLDDYKDMFLRINDG